MDVTQPESKSPAMRGVRVIAAPVQTHSARAYAFAILATVLWLGAFMVGMYVGNTVNGWRGGPFAWPGGLATALVSGGGVLLVTYVLWRVVHDWPHRPPAAYVPRAKRLARVMKHKHAAQRLPHRAVELALLTTHALRRLDQKAFDALPAGMVLAVNLPLAQVITPQDQRFEPLDLLNDVEGPAALAVENVEMSSDLSKIVGVDVMREIERVEGIASPPLTSQADEAVNDAAPGPSSRHDSRSSFAARAARRAWKGFVSLLWVAWSLYWLTDLTVAAVRGEWRGMLVPMFWIASFLAPFLIWLIRTREVFLVPGALLYVTRWQWQASPRLSQLAPDSSPLVLDFNESAEVTRVSFLVRGTLKTVSLQMDSAVGLIAGWLSKASPPTDTQIDAFLGYSAARDRE